MTNDTTISRIQPLSSRLFAMTASHLFCHSRPVVCGLAMKFDHTPSSDNESAFAYVDRSLEILGKTLEIQNEKIHVTAEGYMDSISAHFRRVEPEFKQQLKKMNNRINQVITSLNGVIAFLSKWEEHSKTQKEDILHQIENNDARRHNSQLGRVHGQIRRIKVLEKDVRITKHLIHAQEASRLGSSRWVFHPDMPKHIEDVHLLTQRAKGIHDPL